MEEMNKRFLMLLLIAPLICIGQKDSLITFSEVVKVDSVNQNELFNRARLWVNDNFRSGKDVSQIIDKESGTITGNGVFKERFYLYQMIKTKFTGIFSFDFKIFVKDGKYKYVFTSIKHIGFEENNTNESLGYLTSSEVCPVSFPLFSKNKMNQTWASAKQAATINVEKQIGTLKMAMSKVTESTNF